MHDIAMSIGRSSVFRLREINVTPTWTVCHAFPRPGVSICQDHLKRLAGMSAALSAHSAALKALRAVKEATSAASQSATLVERMAERAVGRGTPNAGTGGGDDRSSLASFLEFQKSLTRR